MTIGSPGIFQRPTRTFNPSFFKAYGDFLAGFDGLGSY